MIDVDSVAGVILAGGKSTRMGRDKALLQLNGKLFIQHITEELQSLFSEVVISANTSEYDFLRLPLVRDMYENCGPLGGIHAALGWVRKPHIMIVPCDAPFLTSSVFSTILEEAEPGAISVASALDQLQPLVGVYPKECLSSLEIFISSGGRKVMDFLAAAAHRVIEHPAWEGKLQNINDMRHYRSLLDSE